MREVAVTEGDKVQAQMDLGFGVYGYGVGDLVAVVNQIKDAQIDELVQEYLQSYDVVDCLKPKGERHESLRERCAHRTGHA